MSRIGKELKRTLIGIGAAICVGFIGIVAVNLLNLKHGQQIHADFIADFRDDRVLAGAVHNIFVGRVITQSGTKSLGAAPETQFQVEVLENIKGQLSGTVVVNQQGGYRNNSLIVMEGDTLLTPGKTYLFATRIHAAEGWHTLVPHFGDIPIDSASDRTSLIARFAKAVTDQVPLTNK